MSHRASEVTLLSWMCMCSMCRTVLLPHSSHLSYVYLVMSEPSQALGEERGQYPKTVVSDEMAFCDMVMFMEL